MANISILFSAASDGGTISGGAWTTGLPLANVRTTQPGEVARTTNALAASTKFVIDMTIGRPVGMFGLVNHNLSGDATVRLQLSNNADGSAPLIDVTIPGREPNVPFGSLPWGEFHWEGYASEATPGGAITSYTHSDVPNGRYILVDITDTGNPDGYVEIGRFMAGLPFTPKYNMGYGAAISFVDESTKTRSIGGALWCDVKTKHRRLALSFPFMTRNDALGRMYDLQNNLGTTGELLAIYDPAEPGGVRARRTLYGVQEDLAPIVEDNASIDAPFTTSLTIEEMI